MRTRQVTVYGCRVELSNFEYRVLEHLMLRAGEVVSKTELSQRLYGEEQKPEYNAIDTLIAKVRRHAFVGRHVSCCHGGKGDAADPVSRVMTVETTLPDQAPLRVDLMFGSGSGCRGSVVTFPAESVT